MIILAPFNLLMKSYLWLELLIIEKVVAWFFKFENINTWSNLIILRNQNMTLFDFTLYIIWSSHSNTKFFISQRLRIIYNEIIKHIVVTINLLEKTDILKLLSHCSSFIKYYDFSSSHNIDNLVVKILNLIHQKTEVRK